jgi:hypothetical protein
MNLRAMGQNGLQNRSWDACYRQIRGKKSSEGRQKCFLPMLVRVRVHKMLQKRKNENKKRKIWQEGSLPSVRDTSLKLYRKGPSRLRPVSFFFCYKRIYNGAIMMW